MSQCRRCSRNIQSVRTRYDSLIRRGYSSKDAIAKAFYQKNMSQKDCCVVSIRQHIDVDVSPLQRLQRQKSEKEKQDLIRSAAGKPALLRPKGKTTLVAADATGTNGGQIILLDSNFLNPRVLTRSITNNEGVVSTTPGFKVTNMTPLPQKQRDRLKWTSTPLILWSGDIKIVPIYTLPDGSIQPGRFLILDTDGSALFPLDKIDKTLLEAEIIEMIELPIQHEGGFMSVGHRLILEKQYPEDIVATGVIGSGR